MDVYNSMAGVAGSTVTSNIFSKVNPLDAVAAAECFHTFRDGVEMCGGFPRKDHQHEVSISLALNVF